MGLSGQVVVERAGAPGTAAAGDPEAGSGLGRAGVGSTTAVAGCEGTAPGFAAANGGAPSGADDLPGNGPSGVGDPSDAVNPPGNGSPDTSTPSGAGSSSGGVGSSVEDVMESLEDGAAVLEAARALALPAGRVFDIQEAADFAARVEDLSPEGVSDGLCRSSGPWLIGENCDHDWF